MSTDIIDEQLRAESAEANVERLREALQGFVDEIGSVDSEWLWYGLREAHRRALEVLAETKPDN